jgi:hypothetical protein
VLFFAIDRCAANHKITSCKPSRLGVLSGVTAKGFHVTRLSQISDRFRAHEQVAGHIHSTSRTAPLGRPVQHPVSPVCLPWAPILPNRAEAHGACHLATRTLQAFTRQPALTNSAGRASRQAVQANKRPNLTCHPSSPHTSCSGYDCSAANHKTTSCEPSRLGVLSGVTAKGFQMNRAKPNLRRVSDPRASCRTHPLHIAG